MTDRPKNLPLENDPLYGPAVREAARINKPGGIGRDEPNADVNVMSIAIERMANDLFIMRKNSTFDREAAIARLRSWGHSDAYARDWVMGETIVIPLGPVEETSPGVKASVGAICLYPHEDAGPGYWGLMDYGHVNRVYESLAKCIDGAHEFIKLITPYLRKMGEYGGSRKQPKKNADR